MQSSRISSAVALLVRSTSDGTAELVQGLEAHGFRVASAASLQHAVMETRAQEYPIIIFDLAACGAVSAVGATARGDSSVALDDEPLNAGLHALREIRQSSPASQVVMIVGRDLDLATCCQAVRYGAASFVEWKDGQPVDGIVDRLWQALERYRAAIEEGRAMHSRQIFDEAGIASQSEIMAKLLFHAKRAAIISDAPILICGESGTGKQLLAEAIHRMDPKRKNKPFLTVNCAAITGTLAESALFGHRKGAFTGATQDRPGYFRAAQGGTLLLDEISELEKSLQPKLLRVLQAGRVLPVGDDAEHEIDVRVIVASNRPLPVMVEQGEFRLDLYQRLNVISLEVPPLRDRPEDIPLLVQFFLRRYASYYPQPIESVDDRVFEVLGKAIGSGNVRELENAVRQILAFKTAGTRIELSDIPPGLLARQASVRAEQDVTDTLASAALAMIRSGRMTLSEMLEDLERMILSEAVARANGTQSQLAQQLGLSRRTFYNKLRKHDLPGSH